MAASEGVTQIDIYATKCSYRLYDQISKKDLVNSGDSFETVSFDNNRQTLELTWNPDAGYEVVSIVIDKTEGTGVPTETYDRDALSHLSSLYIQIGGSSDSDRYKITITTGPLPLFTARIEGNLEVTGETTADNHVATKKYVDALVGNIGTLLDTINGEVV